MQIYPKSLAHEPSTSLGMNFSHSCFGISTKLANAQLPQSLFHKIAAEELRSGKSNSVELYNEALNELEG